MHRTDPNLKVEENFCWEKCKSRDNLSNPFETDTFDNDIN